MQSEGDGFGWHTAQNYVKGNIYGRPDAKAIVKKEVIENKGKSVEIEIEIE